MFIIWMSTIWMRAIVQTRILNVNARETNLPESFSLLQSSLYKAIGCFH